MNTKTDHSLEVERRITAIRISPSDSCSFFKQRESALVCISQCFYCTYGVFEQGMIGGQEKGLCKFKR